MGAFGSAVQPANRKKQPMFGDSAPIWAFLNSLHKMGYSHDHRAYERLEASGRFFFEVFPALGNLGLFHVFYARRSVPRYNPQRRTFALDDWKLLSEQVQIYLQGYRIDCAWIVEAKALSTPSKQIQDQLDAMICLCHAMSWTGGKDGIVVGDMDNGYIVVPSHDELTVFIRALANDHGVEFWPSELCVFGP